MSLVPTLKLSLEMTNVLSQIERNGLRINLDTLADIRKQYEEEMLELEARLMELAREAMGDTPINLSSPDDRSVCCCIHVVCVTRRSGRVCSIWGMKCVDRP